MRKFIIKIEIFAWTMTMGRYEHVDLIIRLFRVSDQKILVRARPQPTTGLKFSATSGRVKVQLGSSQTHILCLIFELD